MKKIANRFNSFLILVISIAPFIGFITISILNMDFNRIFQLFSYIGVFLILISQNDFKSIKFPKYLVFLLLFIIYVFYSDLYRLNRDFKLMYLFSNQLIGGFNMMFIIENLDINKPFFKKIIKISKVVLIIAVFVIVIQQIYNSSFFVNKGITAIGFVTLEDINKTRLVSIYSWLGGLLKVGFSFVPIYLLIVEYQEKKKGKIILWILVGLLFAFLSKARWIMVNSMLVFLMLFIQNKRKIYFFTRYLILIPLIIALAFMTLESLGVNVSKIVKERILESDKRGINNKSAGTRLLAIAAFNKLYWDQPIFGKGSIKYGMGGTGRQDYKLRSFLKGRSSQIHVGYLSLFYMYGLVGGFLFLFFLSLLVIKLYKNAKKTSFWAPFFGVLGFVLANITLVQFSLLEMGIIIALFTDRFINQEIKTKHIVDF